MTSTKPIDLEVIKNIINAELDVVLEFAEFVIGEKVSLYNTRVVAELRLFQEKLSKANSPFLKTSETLRLQNSLLRLIINWNPAISSQLLSVVNFYVDINKMMTRPVTLREVNPIELVFQNRDKFERGHELMSEVSQKFKIAMIDAVDLYSLFYCMIASVESIEYPLYKGFIEDLKRWNLTNKYDPNTIFSVTSKTKSDKGFQGYQTDSRMIRNALGHFDYLVNWSKDGFRITFSNPNDSNASMQLDHTQFMKFIENHRFLMQSIFRIHLIMIIFSTMRVYFAID